MSEKLKPCPFCGKKARTTLLINTRDGTATDAVICGNSRCRVRPHVDAATVAQAIRLWNTRKDASHE